MLMQSAFQLQRPPCRVGANVEIGEEGKINRMGSCLRVDGITTDIDRMKE